MDEQKIPNGRTDDRGSNIKRPFMTYKIYPFRRNCAVGYLLLVNSLHIKGPHYLMIHWVVKTETRMSEVKGHQSDIIHGVQTK